MVTTTCTANMFQLLDGVDTMKLRTLLALSPLEITPELATIRDSLIVEKLNETSEVLRQLLEGSNGKSTSV